MYSTKYQVLHQPNPEYSTEKHEGVNNNKYMLSFSEKNRVSSQTFSPVNNFLHSSYL